MSYFFGIKKIEIYGISNFKKEKIEKKIDFLKGRNIIFISRDEFTGIIKEFNFVQEFEIKKVYPNTIKLTIKESNPIGIFLHEEKKLVLLEGGKSTKHDQKKNFHFLPLVYGENADKNFFIFYESLKDIDFQINLIKEFKYFETNRWDIILKDDKLIKLPSMNYKNALKEFLHIYKQDSFKKFKIFDFRVKGQLVIK